MRYTLFYSRLRDLSPEGRADYAQRSDALLRAASERHPGFVDIKSFTAEDGERLSVVRFRDEASQDEWRRDADHADAQAKGRSDFYESYRVTVCDEVRSHEWKQGDDSSEERGV